MANRDIIIKAIAETTKKLIREKSVDKITVTPVYNFINNRLADKSAVLKPL